MKAGKLSPKKLRFANEYIIDLNAAQAVIRAGYSKNGASVQGCRLLADANVQAAIAEAMQARSERSAVSADYVVRKLYEIAEMDVLDILTDEMSIKPVGQWPKVWRQYLSGFDLADMFEGSGGERELVGVLKKIRWPDKVKNLELLGKHLGVFSEKVELSGPGGGAIPHAVLSQEQVDAALKRVKDEF